MDDTVLVTIDVESLYTSLRHLDVVSTTYLALDAHTDLKTEQKKFVMSLLELAMTNNYFWHKGSYYKQIKGVAIGAKYAPSVANLLLSHWEE